MFKRWMVGVGLSALAWSMVAVEEPGAGAWNGLRVATFDVDATPPLGSLMAYDPVTGHWDMGLRARGMVLLGAGDPVVLCAVDWIGLANDGYEEFRAALAKAAGTVRERVALHAVHQHDAPNCDFSAESILLQAGVDPGPFGSGFQREVMARLSQAVEQSVQRAEPVTHLGLGQAQVQQVASNRRIMGTDGKVRATRWTATRDPELRAEPEGTIDPMVSVVSLWNETRPVVVLSYYATHPQSYYRTGCPNPDFPGVARFLRQLAVPSALHVHFTGAGGNLGAGKYNDGAPENRMRLAERLADGMRRAWERTVREPITPGEVHWTVERVALPVARHLSVAQLEAAVREGGSAGVSAATRLAWLRRCESGHPVEVSVLGLGRARLLHLPGELFVEYQLAAKAMRPDLFVAVAAYGDYAPWYIGTEAAYAEGGYETGPGASNVAPETEPVLLGAMTRLLEAEKTYDIVIYGGTAAGVMAAVQAKRMGRSVMVVCPDRHLGGLSSGGLGFTDTGDKSVIGGLAREFYGRVYQHYQRPEAWRWQKREEYGNRGQGTPAIDGAQRTMWIFEPHVAERVFEDLVAEYAIPVYRDEWLDREQGVVRDGRRIVSVAMLSGKRYRARVFIDATYEGDLMAAAGVAYHVGREARSEYGEQWAGVQTGVLHHRHHFGVLPEPIDPYVVRGDPASGVLPRISPQPPGVYGEGDDKVQAYCFRMCLTRVPENRVPFAKPDGYDAGQYELLVRIFAAGWRETFDKFDPIPNDKTDTNNHGPMSTDNIGMNYDYPDASYERRREIVREHETYQKGWLYFVANDPRVPEEVRREMRRWGLAKDEFVDNGHWPHQLYVREARRMIGRYVMTENELLKRRPTPEPIGMGSYGIDSHNVQRYITPEGHVQNEGDIGVSTQGPYQIALGSIQPKREECENLLVPVCVSSSHIAFGSIRMEPVFMILGQSAATVAAMAIEGDVAVQEVDYAGLRRRLLADHQVLEP